MGLPKDGHYLIRVEGEGIILTQVVVDGDGGRGAASGGRAVEPPPRHSRWTMRGATAFVRTGTEGGNSNVR